MRLDEKEDGTFSIGTEVEVTIAKGGNNTITGPVALTCRSEETEPFREFLAKVGDKGSILLIVTL